MRKIIFFVIMSFGLLFGACKKDDNRVCVPSDFLGTYTGSTVCANGGAANGTVIVSAGPTDSQLSIDLDGALFTVDIDGCNFSGTQRDTNVDLEYSGSLNGNKIEVTLRGLVFMNVIDCTSTGSK